MKVLLFDCVDHEPKVDHTARVAFIYKKVNDLPEHPCRKVYECQECNEWFTPYPVERACRGCNAPVDDCQCATDRVESQLT